MMYLIGIYWSYFADTEENYDKLLDYSVSWWIFHPGTSHV